MPLHLIKQGLDIPVKGRATGAAVPLPAPSTVAYSPTEFPGVVPRLDAREGDAVKAGAPLFHDKSHPEMKFLSPVSGVVREVRRGHRRVITDIVVERTGDDAVSFPTYTAEQVAGMDRAAARGALLAGGLWACLRTRPLDVVPSPDGSPQSILIGAMETGPAMPGAEVLVSPTDGPAFRAGAKLLGALTDGPVFLAVEEGTSHPAFSGVQGLTVHTFKGPHPAGDPGVQINFVDPPRGHNQVWYIRAWDVVLIGRLLLEGRFPTERIYTASGTGLKQQRVVSTVLGAPLADIAGPTIDEETRWIRGSVLTGDQVESTRWASFSRRNVHVLPSTVERELFGWMAPRLGRWSAFRAFVSGFVKPSRDYDFRPGLNGGHRAIVPVEVYNRVVATPDIEPTFLFKSVVAGDMQESIQLGLLDITREEAALLTFVCPAKIEYDVLLNQGLEQYQKEM